MVLLRSLSSFVIPFRLSGISYRRSPHRSKAKFRAFQGHRLPQQVREAAQKEAAKMRQECNMSVESQVSLPKRACDCNLSSSTHKELGTQSWT